MVGFRQRKNNGRVWLIGAGPGDPGLLTIKGLGVLRQADAVVYDYLVNPRLLEETRPDAQLLYVGKQAGRHTAGQSEINQTLIELAQSGLNVVRLKGGDPFVFGRGGEEGQALREAGIAFEVVPGISSPIAVAAYAGIPITHRDFTSSFTVITGHEDPKRDSDAASRLDWEALARVGGTLVFLMGVSRLGQISARLQEAGMNAGTPVAVIQWGTTWQQRTVTGDLTNIAERAQEAQIKPPAITVIGQVAGLREELQWFEASRPLLGRRIVVSQSGLQASDELVARLSEAGAGVVEFPVGRAVAPASFEALDRAIANLSEFDWLIFPHPAAVDYFWRRLWTARLDSRRLAHLRLAVSSPGAATALEERGLIPDLMLDPAQLPDRLTPGAKILLPCAESQSDPLTAALRSYSAQVEAVPAYRLTLEDGLTSPAQLIEWLETGQVDLVSFGSAQAVQDFAAVLPDQPISTLLAHTPLAATGPATQALRELGLRNITTHQPTTESILETILTHFSPVNIAQADEG